MGCNPQNDCSSDSCERFEPGTGEGVTLVEFKEYPSNAIRGGAYNIPGRDGSTIMYPSIALSGSSVANCGKYTKSACGETLYFDYYPDGLSYDHGFSDTWFSYLYDTSNDAGVVGTPCYHIETQTVTNTQTGASSSTDTCYPCGAFTCTPATTTIRYDVPGAAECGCADPDCPHPTLFSIGSLSKKVVFSYNSLSTTLPNGVSDFEVSDDGTTWTDVWNENTVVGTEYISGDNPYMAGDEFFDDFKIFTLNSGASTNFSVKARIKAVYDDSGATTTFSGTSWTISEILSPGVNYSAGQTFTLEYTHTHPNNSTSVLNLNLRVKTVQAYQATEGQEGFDVLRAGDTINGHTVKRVFHTDLDNFPYHIAYIDGNGSDFAKETQYTSNRNHVITVKAGFRVPDRAILVGFYEFLDKSVQYVPADVDQNAPDTYNVLRNPIVDVTITNGILTGVQLVDGGSGWNEYGRIPKLIVTPPQAANGTQAEVKAAWTNGVLTGVKVSRGGSGYSHVGGQLPKIYVQNVFKEETNIIENAAYRDTDVSDFQDILNSIPGGTDAEMLSKVADCWLRHPRQQTDVDFAPRIDLKQDPDLNRVQKVPQYHYKSATMEEFDAKFAVNYSLLHVGDVYPAWFGDVLVHEKDRNKEMRLQDIEDITQVAVPAYAVNRERMVTTVQGRFSGLPHASTYTKYHMRQYRADATKKVDINVTLTCTPVDSGCGHIGCSPPNTGNVNSSSGNTVTTYTMSPLLGSGCKTWNAVGTLPMYNSLTKSANVWSDAITEYGNPFNTGEYLP